MFVSRFNNSVEPSSSNHHYFPLINEKSLHIAEKRALLIIHSSLSLPRHVMFHKDGPFIAALSLAPFFFFYLTSEQTFFFLLPRMSAYVTDPDVQRGWNVCVVGRGERAAAAEFPRARRRRALSGPGSLRDWKHVCVRGEKSAHSSDVNTTHGYLKCLTRLLPYSVSLAGLR